MAKREKYKITYKATPLLYKFGIALLVLSAVLALFWYTEKLRSAILENNRRIITAHAKLFAIAKSETFTGPGLTIIFNEVIQKSDYPMIHTNSDREPISWRNIDIAPDDTTYESRQQLKGLLDEMASVVKPVEINVGTSDQVLGYIYFGEPSYTRWIRVIPLLELIFLSIVAFIGMSYYNRSRNWEKQNIWLGMAREMAHQLGTPISSLLGWIEITREQLSRNTHSRQETEDGDNLTDFLYEVVDEMDKDIQVLSRIVIRFGQIGSMPELKPTRIDQVIKSVTDYLKERIPRLREKVRMRVELDPVPMVRANELLISWACENLIKNAADAIGRDNGEIKVSVRQNLERDRVQIIITDNGKGIPVSDQKKIFSPGFTTKKRGWGIGLSLTKRIAEEYHHGSLTLLESIPFEKTTFIIELPVERSKS